MIQVKLEKTKDKSKTGGGLGSDQGVRRVPGTMGPETNGSTELGCVWTW